MIGFFVPEARKQHESMSFRIREVLPAVWGQPTYRYVREAT